LVNVFKPAVFPHYTQLCDRNIWLEWM